MLRLLLGLVTAVLVDGVLAYPNFVFVLTNEQNYHMNSLVYMLEVKKQLCYHLLRGIDSNRT